MASVRFAAVIVVVGHGSDVDATVVKQSVCACVCFYRKHASANSSATRASHLWHIRHILASVDWLFSHTRSPGIMDELKVGGR